MKSVLFFILAVFFLAPQAKAVNIYVSNLTGNDADNGTTDALAVKTLDQATTLATATTHDIYLKCNESWALEDIRLEVAGTTGDRFTFGAYWMDSGTETIVNSTGCPSGEDKPEISGAFINDTTEGSFPAIWKPLVWVREDYITVQDIKIINSSYSGIEVDNNWTYATLQRLDISHVSHSGVIFEGGSSKNILRDSTLYQVVLSRALGFSTGYGGCVKLANSSQNLIENNTISDCGGDGVNPYDDANKNLILDNTILGIDKSAVYIDNSSDNIIDRNIVAGGSSSTYNWDLMDSGIKIGIEDTYSPMSDSNNNIVRNNLIANVQTCFTTGAYPAAIVAGKTAGFRISGNTCVGFDEIVNQIADNTGYDSGSTVSNNIFQESSVGTGACDAKGTVANVTWSYNHFDYTPATAECTGTGDVTTLSGPPLYTTATFTDYGVLNVPTFADFGLDGVAPTNKASEVGDPRVSNVLTLANYPLSSEIAGTWDDTHSIKELYYDYEGLARDAVTPDIGALEPGSESPDTAETLPFYMDVGGTGCAGGVFTYETDQYYTGSGYTTTITDAIDNTTDDCAYLKTRGAGTTGAWSIPIDCSGGCDVTLGLMESYWGDEESTCTGGERTFSIAIEGSTEESDFDICAQTQAVNAAYDYLSANVVTGGDNVLNITLDQGSYSC